VPLGTTYGVPKRHTYQHKDFMLPIEKSLTGRKITIENPPI